MENRGMKANRKNDDRKIGRMQNKTNEVKKWNLIER
jgi:hypothetical protein